MRKFGWNSSGRVLGSGLAAAALSLLGVHGAFAQYPHTIVAKGETLRIQIYPGTIGAGHPVGWALKEKGFCADHGIKCQFVELATGTLGLQALAAGSIEIANPVVEAAIQAAARGNDLQLIGSTHPNLYISLNTTKKLPLPNLAKGYPAVMQDFKGKKIGTAARGSGTEIQFRAMLLGAGMKPEDVTFVAVGSPGTAYQALVGGQVDATMSWAPLETVCKLTDACFTVLHTGKGDGPPEIKLLNGAGQSYASRRKFIQENPVAIEAFMQAVQDATTWVKDPKNFDEMLAIAKKNFSLGDVPNAEAGLRQLLKEEIGNTGAYLDRKAVKGVADFVHKYGLVDKPFDTTNFVYRSAPQPK